MSRDMCHGVDDESVSLCCTEIKSCKSLRVVLIDTLYVFCCIMDDDDDDDNDDVCDVKREM